MKKIDVINKVFKVYRLSYILIIVICLALEYYIAKDISFLDGIERGTMVRYAFYAGVALKCIVSPALALYAKRNIKCPNCKKGHWNISFDKKGNANVEQTCRYCKTKFFID